MKLTTDPILFLPRSGFVQQFIQAEAASQLGLIQALGFTMNREEALEALHREVSNLKGRPYATLVPIVSAPLHLEHTLSGRTYQVGISASWDD